MNELYYGDNLAVLREHVADASLEMIDSARSSFGWRKDVARGSFDP